MNVFYLLTIKARRWVTTSLTLSSVGIYTLDLTGLNFLSIQFLGVDGLVKTSAVVGGDPVTTYYHDIANNQLRVRCDASYISALNDIVITHVLSYTNALDLYWNIDPDDSSTRKILFESRLNGRPQFRQSQQNNMVGILSVSISTIDLINRDQGLNQYFTKRDSLKDSEIRIWKCTDSAATRTAFYLGFVSGVNVSSSVTLNVYDFFKKLDSTLYSFDDDSLTSVAKYHITSPPPGQENFPIYKLRGQVGGYKISNSKLFYYNREVVAGTMPRAVCNSYSPTVALATNINRGWTTGFIDNISGYLDTYNITFVNVSVPFENLYLEFSSGTYDFTPGDTVKITGSLTAYLTVAGYSAAGIMFYNPGGATVPIIGDTVSMHKISALAIEVDGVNKVLQYDRDYTVDAYVPGAPITITLANNVEATIGKTSPINPAIDQITYKIRNKTGLASSQHGAQVKELLLEAFDSQYIDSASFAAADVAYDIPLTYTIPLVGSSFTSKREILSKLLSSSFGYLYLNNSFQISYGNYSLPAAETFADITDIEIKNESIGHRIDYQDVYYRTKFINDQFSDYFEIIDSEAQYLHGIKETFEFNHLCAVVGNTAIAHFKKIANFFATPKVVSTFTTLDFSLKIGDRKTLSSQKSLGSARGTIVSTSEGDINLEASMTAVEATEGNKSYSLNNGTLSSI